MSEFLKQMPILSDELSIAEHVPEGVGEGILDDSYFLIDYGREVDDSRINEFFKQIPLPQKVEVIREGVDKGILDDSYFIVDWEKEGGEIAVRYFPDGKTQTYRHFDSEWSDGDDWTSDMHLDNNKTRYVLQSETFPDGSQKEYFRNGTKKSESFTDGTKREWFKDGLIKSEYLPDGTKRIAERIVEYINFEPVYRFVLNEKLPNGTKRKYGAYSDKHGSKWQLREEKLPDGTERKYGRNHIYSAFGPEKYCMVYEKLPDGTERTLSASEFGQKEIEIEKRPDGTKRKWVSVYKNYSRDNPHFLKERTSSDGKKIIYNEKNELVYHETDGKDDTLVYLAKERIKNKKEKNIAKLKDKPKVIQKVATKIADTKMFNDIALKVAMKKNKQSRK